MPTASSHVSVEIAGPIARITINRPERHNAVDLAMWKAIPEAVAEATADPAVRIVIMLGGGDQAFVAGADISEFNAVRCDAQTNRVFTDHVLRATASLREARTPVIAQINGHCIGGGIVLACACDIRIASNDATFAVPAAKLGLGYEHENYAALARLVGHGQATAMVLSARTYDAETALRTGLIQEAVAKTELYGYVESLALTMSKLAPLTLAATKASARADFSKDGASLAQKAIDRCFDSEDFAEGRRAFREKRRPEFDGR